ncbi:hypothetical protein EBI01_07310 [Marinomonas rhizomae]|nr:hypothetical protein EBI01_07310 [Marinomonas rhizomae]
MRDMTVSLLVSKLKLGIIFIFLHSIVITIQYLSLLNKIKKSIVFLLLFRFNYYQNNKKVLGL